MTENPSSEVATKDHSSCNNSKEGTPRALKTKVDVSEVEVKGFPKVAGSAIAMPKVSFSHHREPHRLPPVPSLEALDWFGGEAQPNNHASADEEPSLA